MRPLPESFQGSLRNGPGRTSADDATTSASLRHASGLRADVRKADSPDENPIGRPQRLLLAATEWQRKLSGRPRKTKGSVATLLLTLESLGRGGGIRTRDPLHPMQVRYQAALRPD